MADAEAASSMSDVTLPSGAILHITLADFEDADALQTAILQAARAMPITADLADANIMVLKDAVIAAATSPDVKTALWKCFERSTWNSNKITKALMNDPAQAEKIRGDYYVMAWEVIKANCAPFFAQIFLKYRELLKTKAATPASA